MRSGELSWESRGLGCRHGRSGRKVGDLEQEGHKDIKGMWTSRAMTGGRVQEQSLQRARVGCLSVGPHRAGVDVPVTSVPTIHKN